MSNDSASVWHVVLHESEIITRDTVRQYCEHNIDAKLACREEADEKVIRPHYHIAHIFANPICRSTVRERLKKFFPGITGKKDFTCHLPESDQTIDGLLDYICKNKLKKVDNVPPDIVYNFNNFYNIEEHHDRFHQKQATFISTVKNLAEKEYAKKAIKRKEVLAEARAMSFSNRLEIVDFLYRRMEGKIATFDLTIMVQQIEFQKDPEQSVNLMYQIVNKKLSPF